MGMDGPGSGASRGSTNVVFAAFRTPMAVCVRNNVRSRQTRDGGVSASVVSVDLTTTATTNTDNTSLCLLHSQPLSVWAPFGAMLVGALYAGRVLSGGVFSLCERVEQSEGDARSRGLEDVQAPGLRQSLQALAVTLQQPVPDVQAVGLGARSVRQQPFDLHGHTHTGRR